MDIDYKRLDDAADIFGLDPDNPSHLCAIQFIQMLGADHARLKNELDQVKASAEKEEKYAIVALTERDGLQEYIDQIYMMIIGEPPEWSNLYGSTEAFNDIQDRVLEARAAAVQWVTYDGTAATRPKRWGNEFNIGAVMFFTFLCGGTTMVARMMPFSACRFPSDIDPEDIPDDFEPDEWVWQRVDKFDVVWLARPGDRWAYLPKPLEA